MPLSQGSISGKEYIWIAPRATDVIGLNQFLSIKAIFSCDYGYDAELLEEQVPVISIEKETNVRENWTNQRLKDIFKRTNLSEFKKLLVHEKEKDVCILPYTGTVEIEDFVSQLLMQHLNILSISSKLRNYLENKILSRSFLDDQVISQPSGHISNIDALNYDTLSRQYGNPFVLQMPIETSGMGTRFVNSINDLLLFKKKALHYLIPKVKVTQYLAGLPMAISGVVMDSTVALSPPYAQIIGSPECSKYPECYSGNDFATGSNLDYQIKTSIYKDIMKIGDGLVRLGYRGIFGIDFVLYEDKPFIIEINPRFLGSTQLLTLAQINSGIIPLALLHVASLLNIKKFIVPEEYNQKSLETHLNFSKVVLHNLEEQECIIEKVIRPGTYRLSRKQLIWLNDGSSFPNNCSNDEFLITGGPKAGVIVMPDALLAKIYFRKQISINGKQLTNWASQVTRTVYAEFGLRPLSNSLS